jgi:hypothetical protein
MVISILFSNLVMVPLGVRGVPHRVGARWGNLNRIGGGDGSGFSEDEACDLIRSSAPDPRLAKHCLACGQLLKRRAHSGVKHTHQVVVFIHDLAGSFPGLTARSGAMKLKLIYPGQWNVSPMARRKLSFRSLERWIAH